MDSNALTTPPSGPRPSPDISDLATYQHLHRQSLDDPETFWRAHIARFRWSRAPERILSGESYDAQWFQGGSINLAVNCLDVPIANGHGEKLALIWESEAVNERREPREIRRYSYLRLRQEVVETAQRLVSLGVLKLTERYCVIFQTLRQPSQLSAGIERVDGQDSSP